MSKIYDSLKKLQKKRTDEYSQAIDKAAITEIANSKKEITTKTKGPWLVWLFVGALIFILFAFNIRLFLIAQNYTSTIQVTLSKLTSFEESLNKNASQISNISMVMQEVSSDLEKINSNINDSIAMINEAKKANEVNAFAIENLTKAKNTLFKTVNELTLELDKLKK